jgi:dTDP-4-dehydrorhamnose reductase
VRLVVTGREGQVVRSIFERAAGSKFEIVPLGRPELDLAGEPAAIRLAVEASRPDLLVSAAAYTHVDRAETEPEAAFAVNERGPRALAQSARRLGVPLIHLSTDYVFDGAKRTPYVEEDPTHPTGFYGSSKLAGERAVFAEHEDCVVVRTAWVYSPFGANFVKTMLRLAEARDEVAVVGDQYGNPSSALDIADGILQLASNLRAGGGSEQRGVFHMTGTGHASWAELAEAIFSASAEIGGPAARVRHINSAEYPTAAKRPANSQLDSTKLARVHGIRLPEWRSSLKGVVERLVQAREER